MTKITSSSFSGGTSLYGKKGGLASLLTGIAVDNAVNRVAAMTAANIKFTDNSTGVAAATVTDTPLPSSPVTATGTLGATLAALNTAIGKHEDAGKVMVERLNLVRAKLGLPALSTPVGAEATPGTIPAQDKTVAGTAGTAAASYASAASAFRVAKQNDRRLLAAINEAHLALGGPKIGGGFNGVHAPGAVLVDIPTVTAAAAGGVGALRKTDADAILANLAANIATMASKYNALIDGLAAKSLSVVAGE